jgi:alkylhydroperoxidase family enzyme
MARLPGLRPEEIADPELRALAEASGDEMFAVYGHSPEAFARFLAFYRPLKYGGRLDFALKELVRLRIAALNGCER